MTNQSLSEMLITLPAALQSSLGLSANVLRLPILNDDDIRGGKRAIERSYVDANTTFPSRRRRVEYAIHGPIGASLESSAGYLGIDLCLTGDSVVSLPDDVVAVSRRSYRGEIVKIATANKHQLTGTPNHPVLTQRGWVAMGDLRYGDYLVSRPLGERARCSHPDGQHVEASLSEVYRLAKHLGNVPRSGFLPVDFDEQRRQADIDVVTINGELRNRIKAALAEPVREFAFAASDVLPVSLGGNRPQSSLLVGRERSSAASSERGQVVGSAFGADSAPVTLAGHPGADALGVPLLGSSCGHRECGGLTSGANDPSLLQPKEHGRGGDAEDWRDDPWGLPCAVEFDRLVDIKRNPFRGHVYNLETGTHKFFASAILTHNCQNMDSRWYQRLLPTTEQVSVDLTGDDPPGVDGSYFGTAIFGSSYFGSPLGGGSSGDGPDVVVFAEQAGYLLVFRGALLTQVDTTTTPWTVVTTTVLDANALDADHWRGTVKVAMGPTVAMQRVVGVSGFGPLLEDVVATTPAETVYANAIKHGSDRAWYVNANQGQTTFNFAGFCLDDFVNLANPFQVGDPQSGIDGIGPFGPLTMFGSEDNLYSFTDQGKPVPLSRALYSHHSSLNGKQWADPGWGWNFAVSAINLRAISQSGIDNPVGIGETMRQFTGHNGIAYTVYSERGELWVIYETTGGALYGYRGTFGPETPGSGQPLLFPWFYSAGGFSRAIFSTVTGAPAQGVFVIRGDDTNLVYQTIASDGRDDIYENYTYDTTGPFAAYLTTLNRDVNLLKTLRLARFRTRNIASGSSVALAFAFDPPPTDPASASYVTIGTVTSNGAQTLTAVSSNAPIANISGRTFKPRFTVIAGAADADENPPEIDGTLEVEYDERPAQTQRIGVGVRLTSVNGLDENKLWDSLGALVGQTAETPLLVQIPDNLVPGVALASGGGNFYAFVSGVEKRQDLVQDDVEAVTVFFDVWPQSGAI